MQTKHLLTCAVLSAALLPMSGVRAEDNKDSASMSKDSSSSTSGSRMGAADASMSSADVGEFRGHLEHLKEIFSMIQENSRLALASQDTLVASTYLQQNQHLSHRALGVLDRVTRNWKRMDTPMSADQMGSKDMARFAAESDDTAFVRNTVWQIQSMLMADKLNGRDPMITRQMMEMLDAAIARTNNANYRVSSAYTRHRMQFSEFKMSEPTPAPASSASEQVATTRTTHKLWQEATIEHENLPPRNQVAQAPAPTTEEVMTQETTPEPSYSGSPELPKTGGAPEMLVLLGSSLMGAGGLLLRRRR